MEFLVADAERMFTENGKLQHLSYWSYKVLTRSFLESYQNPPLFSSENHPENFIKSTGYVDFCTWHRYSDFEWFVSNIENEFPGIIFPPIPSKETDGTVDKITELLSSSNKEGEATTKEHPLVRKRIRQLQLTFNVISQLDEIHESNLLKAFTTLDEKGWYIFKEDLKAKNKTSVFSGIKSKGFNLFSKIKNLGEFHNNHNNNNNNNNNNKDSVISSPLGIISTQQSELTHLLNTCFIQIEQLSKYTSSELRYWSDVDALCKPTQGSPLPFTACYIDHLVQHAKNSNLEGVVRFVDDNFAWVEWNNNNNNKEGKISKVSLIDLHYPSSGVSDPAVFAIQEFTAQIESYLMYLTRVPGAVLLKEIEDILWFLSRYAGKCVHAIAKLKETGNQVQSLIKSTEKKPNPEQIEKLEKLKVELSSGSSRLITQYNTFYRLYMRKSLMEVARKFGEATCTLMSDNEFESRLSRANATLTLTFNFTPPVEEEEMKRGNKSSSSSSSSEMIEEEEEEEEEEERKY